MCIDLRLTMHWTDINLPTSMKPFTPTIRFGTGTAAAAGATARASASAWRQRGSYPITFGGVALSCLLGLSLACPAFISMAWSNIGDD